MTPTTVRRPSSTWTTSLLVAALSCAAMAQSPAPPASPAAAPQPKPCQEPERGQFDFWIGDWDVATPDGTVRGRNVIEKIEGGCALRETYTTVGAYTGTSYSFYDPLRKLWHQTWIDNQGAPLYLDGHLEGDRMVLRGDLGGTLQRITWTPQPDGRVRQHWETSTDGGVTWTSAFDGDYRRRK